MIDDIKLGFTLMKHGLQFKSNLFGVFVFVVLGVAMGLSDEYLMPFGGAIIMMGCLMIYQLVHSVTCAGLVQSSPQKKRLQTSVSAVCAFICAMLLNTMAILAELMHAYLNHASTSSVVIKVMMISLSTVVLLVYIGGAMKAFWIATVLLMLTFGVLGFMTAFIENTELLLNLNISLGAAIAISYLAVVVGSILMYWISIALYKKEYSKVTFESELKRAK